MDALPFVVWLSVARSPGPVEVARTTPEVEASARASAWSTEGRAEEKATTQGGEPEATQGGEPEATQGGEPEATPTGGASAAMDAGEGEALPAERGAGPEVGARSAESGSKTAGAGPEVGVKQPAPRPRWWGPEPRPKVSGYGGPALRLSGLHGAFAALVGLEGGINVMQRVTIGASLLWLLNPVEAGSFARGAATRVNLNYGGLVVDVSYVRGRRVAGTIGGLLGGGGACLQNPNNGDCADRTGFFVGEPRAGLRVVLAPVVRLHVGLGYRLIAGRGWSGPPNARLGGPSGAVTLEFGWF